MVRSKLILAIGLCFISTAVLAIGLGPITVKSYLDEPLKAEVALFDVQEGVLKKLQPGVASKTVYQHAGIQYDDAIKDISVTVSGEGDKQYLIVTSKQPMAKANLGLIVKVSIGKHTQYRVYTLLFDPKKDDEGNTNKRDELAMDDGQSIVLASAVPGESAVTAAWRQAHPSVKATKSQAALSKAMVRQQQAANTPAVIADEPVQLALLEQGTGQTQVDALKLLDSPKPSDKPAAIKLASVAATPFAAEKQQHAAKKQKHHATHVSRRGKGHFGGGLAFFAVLILVLGLMIGLVYRKRRLYLLEAKAALATQAPYSDEEDPIFSDEFKRDSTLISHYEADIVEKGAATDAVDVPSSTVSEVSGVQKTAAIDELSDPPETAQAPSEPEGSAPSDEETASTEPVEGTDTAPEEDVAEVEDPQESRAKEVSEEDWFVKPGSATEENAVNDSAAEAVTPSVESGDTFQIIDEVSKHLGAGEFKQADLKLQQLLVHSNATVRKEARRLMRERLVQDSKKSESYNWQGK